MLKAATEAIIAAANEIGKDMEIREDYSGRGMFGEGTTAIVYGSQSDLIVCIATAAINVKGEEDYYDNLADNTPDEELEKIEKPAISVDDFMEAIEHLRFDNMGRYDSIVY